MPAKRAAPFHDNQVQESSPAPDVPGIADCTDKFTLHCNDTSSNLHLWYHWEYQFGDFMCNIIGFIHDFFPTFRFTMTLILALDRFISVFCPFFLHEKFLSFNLCAPSNGLHSIFCSSHPALIRHHGVFPLRPHSEDLHHILWVFRWMSHTLCWQCFVHCFIWNNISINICTSFSSARLDPSRKKLSSVPTFLH